MKKLLFFCFLALTIQSITAQETSDVKAIEIADKVMMIVFIFIFIIIIKFIKLI
jgi:hypothetical protein